MPAKPLPLIAIVLLLPVAVLALLAVRSLTLENDALVMRRERLAAERLQTAAALVVTRLQDLGAKALSETIAAYGSGGKDALTALARKRTFLYAFVFKGGAQLHSATVQEHQYESARLLQDKALSLSNGLDASHLSNAALVPLAGSYTLLRCVSAADAQAVCIAVDSADVATALSAATAHAAEKTGLVNASLADPKGQWADAKQPSTPAPSSHALEGLLLGWQLYGVEPPSGQPSPQPASLLYLAAGVLISGWIAMTWMLHRSSTMREEAAAANAHVIAQLAHELRTPLANLKLHTDLLRRQSADSKRVERYGAILDSEIDRLSHLAENAIAVARGAMTKPKLEFAVPDESLRGILERFEPMLADARCAVNFAPGAGERRRFDKTSWERCIVNLIDNARKYAPGSEISIATTLQSDLLRLDVRDRGPGVPASRRETIFEPLERDITSPASGFGLGLAAVRALARQNEGNCWVEDLNPGAHFILTLRTLPLEDAMENRETT